MANSIVDLVNPRYYSLDEHKISPEEIDPNALYVIDKLRASGFKAYLVGGGVRDLLLGVKPKDFDISTSAKPEEIRALFRNAILIGRRFRLAHIRFANKIIEVATFRSGNTESSELIVRDNEWGTEEEDVLRRDFTINGLYYDSGEQVVIDYVDGVKDAQRKILRTIGQPEARFNQDPVRMIRLIKFCARFHFEIDPPTFEALLSCRKQIVKSSSVRILEELQRMLESGAAKPFFHLLKEYGFLAALLPELAHFMDTRGDSLTLDLLNEIDLEIQEGKKPKDRSFLLSLLVFPLVDAYLKERQKTEERPLHLGQIESSVYHVIDCIFAPFFAIPRRTRAMSAFILTSQYRLAPLDRHFPRHPRLAKDPLTPLSIDLLKMRAKLDSTLLAHFEFWEKIQTNQPASEGDPEEAEVRKRRRRPRRR